MPSGIELSGRSPGCCCSRAVITAGRIAAPPATRSGTPASDVVLDGNWADSCEAGFAVGGRRVMLVNNIAEQVGTGIRLDDATDARVFNNSVLRAADAALVLGERVASALVLNNVLQGDEHNLAIAPPAAAGAGLGGLQPVLAGGAAVQLNVRQGDRSFGDLADWSAASGWDRNSRVAPLVYFKQQDRNGRWRVREACISVTNVTPHFNVGPLGANAYPYAGGGTYILDLPQNWKPHGDPARRVYVFDVQPYRRRHGRSRLLVPGPHRLPARATAAAARRICIASTCRPIGCPPVRSVRTWPAAASTCDCRRMRRSRVPSAGI